MFSLGFSVQAYFVSDEQTWQFDRVTDIIIHEK